jgi:pyridoxal phosphate enzyme (YggS family)
MDPKAHIDRAELQRNLDAVKRRILAACAACDRDANEVTLLAVSKGHPSEKIRVMYEFGLRDFGENYAQELVRKAEELADLKDIRWHFIGHLQSNKINALMRCCHSICSLATFEHAQKIDRICQEAKRKIAAMIEVNIGFERQKSGLTKDDATLLAKQIEESCLHIEMQGIMVIPPAEDSELAATGNIPDSFVIARNFANQIGHGALSLGMSTDLESAIASGSNQIRIGTSLFGQRAKRT